MKQVHLDKNTTGSKSNLPACRNGSHRISFVTTQNADSVSCARCHENYMTRVIREGRVFYEVK